MSTTPRSPTSTPRSRRKVKAVRSGRAHSRPQLVSAANFLLATRDSGYKSTALALAELVDNSLQAGARSVEVRVLPTADETWPLELLVIDDGRGMDPATLTSALAFGGSTRFDDRSSLGRYGMGLPNGGLSRARRIEVYTWSRDQVWTARLDIDEIVNAGRRTLPPAEAVERPAFLPMTGTGTAVRLCRCDRLEYRRASALIKRLHHDLGRIYRHFLVDDVELLVNGSSVKPVDPLHLLRVMGRPAGRQFGDTLRYRLEVEGRAGDVTVRFSELPVDRWHDLPAAEKKLLGVTSGACVSVVRAGREVDRGWYFMGAKRRENYDDWWRCEVSFDPSLDELFGMTSAKQAICPTDELNAVLVPDLEPIARALNSRVRRRFELVKMKTPLDAAEEQAARAEAILPALPKRSRSVPPDLRALLRRDRDAKASNGPYKIIVSELPSTAAFELVVEKGQLVLLLNPHHPLFRDLYGPLAMSESEKDQDTAKRVALAVLAAARAEAGAATRADRAELIRFRKAWADVLATFFNA